MPDTGALRTLASSRVTAHIAPRAVSSAYARRVGSWALARVGETSELHTATERQFGNDVLDGYLTCGRTRSDESDGGE